MPQETKSERLNLTITPTERRALEFLARMHPDKYDGWTLVARDYSLNDAVKAYQAAERTFGSETERRTGEDRREVEAAS